VNRVVSPYISTTNAILHWLRSKKVHTASLLHNLPGELLDVMIEEGGKLANKKICEIKLPSKAIIATVLRQGEVLTATGDLMLVAGDQVLIFCHPTEVKKIHARLL
jgi:trk system potassium uptake protein